jgi:anti-anti-sigma factor
VRLTDSTEPDPGHAPAPQISKPAWEITRAEPINRTTVVLALAGEFDLAAYEPVGGVLRALERRDAPLVVIDLEHVSFIGNVGIRFLVEAQERADLGGWALVIVAPRDPTYDLLALPGVDDELNIIHRLPRSPRSG